MSNPQDPFLGRHPESSAADASDGLGESTFHDSSALADTNPRRRAGYRLALGGKCQARGKVVRVPSRSRPDFAHLVNMKYERDPRCGCKDAIVNRQICAHIWAARFVLGWDGEVHDPEPKYRKQKTYPRCWATYNAAEVGAPAAARALIAYLAQTISQLPEAV